MAFAIPNRPFATEPITGLMLPDGVFEASIGKQTINAHISNTGATVNNVQVYVESVSDPGIVVTPGTVPLATAAGGTAHLVSWDADFSAASPGKHMVSFIVETPTGDIRIIKHIFVTRLSYNPGDGSFSATTPEGVLTLEVNEVVRPKNSSCCRRPRPHDNCDCGDKDVQPRTARSLDKRNQNEGVTNSNVLDYIVNGYKGHDPNFEFCSPSYLFKDIKATVRPIPPYPGQYGDLPYQDPWWKVLLCILALLLLIGAAIAEAVDGEGDITVSGGTGGSGSDDDCCGIEAEGGGTSYVAAGLVAAAAAVATAAAASDERDPFRKGADKTAPTNPAEITVSETLEFKYKYADPIELGKPFKVGAEWKYTRTTNAKAYVYETTEENANVHLLSNYEIDAPDTVLVYKREQFIIEAKFSDVNDKLFKGNQLFVQCFLIGPNGQWRKIVLQDNGMPLNADKKANDGIYTGRHFFSSLDKGLWTYFVIAQDINTAQPDMEPEEAAQIIGGMVITNQLIITFDGGECALVPDGHIHVIAQ